MSIEQKISEAKAAAETKTNNDFKGALSHKIKGVANLPKLVVPVAKRTITCHKLKVYCAAWQTDSLHVVTAGQEGAVVTSNASSNIIVKLPIKSDFVMQVAACDNLVACGGMKNLVELHNVAETRPVKKIDLKGHDGYISQLHFMENGAKLLSGSGDGLAILWDVNKGIELMRFEGCEQDVSGIGLDNGDSKVFGTSSTDKSVRLWDMRMKGPSYCVRSWKAKYPANCCAVMPLSKGVVVGCDNASYEYWDVGSNIQAARGKVKKGRCESIAVSPSGRQTYTGWDTGVMLVADSYIPDNRKEMSPVDEGKERDQFGGHSASICSLGIAPDGSALLSGSFDKTAKIWGAE